MKHSIILAAAVCLMSTAAFAEPPGGGGIGGGTRSGVRVELPRVEVDVRGGRDEGRDRVRDHDRDRDRGDHRGHRRHGGGFGGIYLDLPYIGNNECRWLKRRARATGSRYWWQRYYDCVEGY